MLLHLERPPSHIHLHTGRQLPCRLNPNELVYHKVTPVTSIRSHFPPNQTTILVSFPWLLLTGFPMYRSWTNDTATNCACMRRLLRLEGAFNFKLQSFDSSQALSREVDKYHSGLRIFDLENLVHHPPSAISQPRDFIHSFRSD
jgi:hypothetical protein